MVWSTVSKVALRHVLTIHVKQNVIADLDQCSLRTIGFPVCRLQSRKQLVDSDMVVHLIKHCSFGTLGDELKVANWTQNLGLVSFAPFLSEGFTIASFHTRRGNDQLTGKNSPC